MRQAVLIYNPKSGRQAAKRRLPTVLETLKQGGFLVEPAATAGPGDATRLARQAVSEGMEVAFAMGGDGTAREVARGLLGSEVALAILPTGTTNVMTRALGLPRSAEAAAQAMATCRRRTLDVGLAGDEPFLMLASAGLDSAVMARQDPVTKKRFGQAAIAWTGLQQWWAYAYPEIELRLDRRTVQVRHFAACNIPFYAGAFRLAPNADPGDGYLDLMLFHGVGRVATLGLARDVCLGRHLRRRDVETQRIREIELVGPSDCRVQIDGDVLSCSLPLRIRLSRRKLWVLASIEAS